MDLDHMIMVLENLNGPIRVPTACWLFSDLYNKLDSEVRVALSSCEDIGWIKIDNGGWIHVI